MIGKIIALFASVSVCNCASLSGVFLSGALVDDSAPVYPGYVVNTSPRPQVFYDFDMDSDIDDVADAVLLLNLEHQGKLDIVGSVATSANQAAPTWRAIANYYGRAAIPVGINTNSVGSSGDLYDSNIATNYGVAGFTNYTQFPNYITVQRQILASAAGNSIEYITTGDLSSVQGLLQSSADGYSASNGVALVAQKIRNLWCVAGNWPNSGPASDLGSTPSRAVVSNFVITNWPTSVPIIFVNLLDGDAVMTGATVMEAMNSANPARVAWELFFGNSNPANSQSGWSQIGLIAMVDGIYPNGGFMYMRTVGPGTAHCDPATGNTSFNTGLNSNHFYTVRMTDASTFSSLINSNLKDPSAW